MCVCFFYYPCLSIYLFLSINLFLSSLSFSLCFYYIIINVASDNSYGEKNENLENKKNKKRKILRRKRGNITNDNRECVRASMANSAIYFFTNYFINVRNVNNE